MRLNSSKKFLESTTVQVLTITLCVFAIVALLLRLRLHQTMLSVVTTSYASIDETRAHIEGQIWLPDLRQRDVENYCAGFVYTEMKRAAIQKADAVRGTKPVPDEIWADNEEMILKLSGLL